MGIECESSTRRYEFLRDGDGGQMELVCSLQQLFLLLWWAWQIFGRVFLPSAGGFDYARERISRKLQLKMAETNFEFCDLKLSLACWTADYQSNQSLQNNVYRSAAKWHGHQKYYLTGEYPNHYRDYSINGQWTLLLMLSEFSQLFASVINLNY